MHMAQNPTNLRRQAVRVDPSAFRSTYKGLGKNDAVVLKALLDKFRKLYQLRSPTGENKELLVSADSINCALVIHDAAIYDAALDWGLHEFYQDIIMDDGFFTAPVFFTDSIIEGLASLVVYFGHQFTQKIRSHPTKTSIVIRAHLLWKCIWEQRRALKLHTKSEHHYVGKNWASGTSWSEPIVQLAFVYHELLEMEVGRLRYNEMLIDTYIQHVALYCLLSFKQTSTDRVPDPDYRDFAYEALSSLILADRIHTRRLVSEVLLTDDGQLADSFAQYLSELLQRDEPVDGLEFDEFQNQKQSVIVLGCHPSITERLWKYRGHEHCVRAMANVFWNTSTGTFMSDWYSCQVLTGSILELMERSAWAGAPIVYCRGVDVVTECARIIDCLLVNDGSMCLVMVPNAPSISGLQTQCKNDQPTLEFLQSMKKGMKEEWWVTRLHMDAQRPAIEKFLTPESPPGVIEKHDDIRVAWDTLAHALGLDDEEENQRFHKSRSDRCLGHAQAAARSTTVAVSVKREIGIKADTKAGAGIESRNEMTRDERSLCVKYAVIAPHPFSTSTYPQMA
ncbi:unnamed protein product [Peniophora sp. CBMAI 1063]|nr:unnamed protein product [Peniophora sp. CBMAI 1063]